MKNDELKHYGVLGMKWGIKRGRSDKVYAKASRKLEKIDRRIEKHLNKSRKRIMQADKHFRRRDVYRDLADRSSRKAIANMRKAEKWVRKMEKAFANTSIELTQEQIAIGKKYADSLEKRSVTIGNSR